MALQNRVNPFGSIEAVAARGLFTGNRGVIHNPETKTLLKRGWTTKAWIVCALEYKGHHREPMGRNTRSGNAGWTELFFLDEVTAFAAGHRPCFYCRRERAKAYALCFAEAFAVADPKVADMDGRLHAERMAVGAGAPEIHVQNIATLPDGAMIAAGDSAFAVRGGQLLPWHFSGYGQAVDPAEFAGEPIRVLTPATTIAVLRNGYRPIWHSNAS